MNLHSTRKHMPSFGLPIFVALLCLCTVGVASAQIDTVREWTDSTGQFKVKAKLLEVKDGIAFLESADGRTLKFQSAA